MSSKLFVCAVLCMVNICAISADSEPTPDKVCPQVCPLNFAPVCASNSQETRQFSNTCSLNVLNCQREKEALELFTQTDLAWCTSTQVDNLIETLNLDSTKPGCAMPCPANWVPLCATNGDYRSTLGNDCELQRLNCLIGSEDESIQLRSLKDGEC